MQRASLCTDCCSAQRQKNALAEQQVRFHELLEENRQLQDQHDISLRDNFEVTEFLRREIVTKDEKISSLQGKMDEVGSLTFLLLPWTSAVCTMHTDAVHRY